MKFKQKDGALDACWVSIRKPEYYQQCYSLCSNTCPKLANPDDVFPVDVNQPVLQVFTDAAFGNDLTRRQSTTGIVLTYFYGTIIYQLKTQTLTVGSSTQAEFIATVTTAKLTQYL